MRAKRTLLTLILSCTVAANMVAGQGDPAARLREVLPADVAERVLARIAEARARDLPAVVLERRALKFAARGVDPVAIEKSVSEHADRMQQAKGALEAARNRRAESDELDAGADAVRKGVSGASLSALARAAPSGRSLAVPLYVLGSLLDRGLPAAEAIERVQARLTARATDAEFQNMAMEPAGASRANSAPGLSGSGRALGRSDQGPPARGRSGVVPGNAGKDVRPTTRPGRGRGGL
jgi:hypothetical protein